MSADLRVANTFWQVGEFANIESDYIALTIISKSVLKDKLGVGVGCKMAAGFYSYLTSKATSCNHSFHCLPGLSGDFQPG